MMMHRWMAALLLVAATASGAAAQNSMGSFQGLFTAHLGLATGGDLSETGVMPGASVAVHEQDGWGAELDFGHAGHVASGAQALDLTTYMVNAAWMKPTGFIRPFGIAGAGVMQIDGCDVPCDRPATTYDFGFTAGAGVFARLNDTVGVRGDVRFFGSSADHPDLRRAENLSFWRASIGVTLQWAIVP